MTKEVVNLDNIELTKKGIPSMLNEVKKQIKAITKGIPTSAGTSTAPEGFPFSVKACQTVEDLIKMHSFISIKEYWYNKSAKTLGASLKAYPCIISGHEASVWLKDIDGRIAKVENKTTLEELKEVQRILENNMSEEAKFAKEMAGMVNILKGIQEKKD